MKCIVSDSATDPATEPVVESATEFIDCLSFVESVRLVRRLLPPMCNGGNTGSCGIAPGIKEGGMPTLTTFFRISGTILPKFGFRVGGAADMGENVGDRGISEGETGLVTEI